MKSGHNITSFTDENGHIHHIVMREKCKRVSFTQRFEHGAVGTCYRMLTEQQLKNLQYAEANKCTLALYDVDRAIEYTVENVHVVD